MMQDPLIHVRSSILLFTDGDQCLLYGYDTELLHAAMSAPAKACARPPQKMWYSRNHAGFRSRRRAANPVKHNAWADQKCNMQAF